MDNNSGYTFVNHSGEAQSSDSYTVRPSGAPESERTPAGSPVQKKNKPRSAQFFSLPARVGLWIVGAAAGVTVLFACVLVWMGGLRYLGVVDSADKAQGNTYNFYVDGQKQPEGEAPSTDEEIEDFFNDYFGDYFGGFFGGDTFGDSFGDSFGVAPGGGESVSPEENSGQSAGLGIKAVELTLEFKVDDKYSAGLVIDTIEDYSSFIGTDVKVNDMIVAANGKPTPTVDDLKSEFTAVGDDITLTIARYSGGVASTFDVTVKLVAMQ